MSAHRASASRTSLLLACGYWARVDVAVEDRDTDAARLGREVHRVGEEYIAGRREFTLSDAAGPYAAHLVRWLSEQSEPMRAERAYVYDAATDTARGIVTAGARGYGDVGASEIPGTADLVFRRAGVLHVVDIKTGDAEPAAANRQLRTLGLMVAREHGEPDIRVGLLFVQPDGVSEDWADLDLIDLDAHAEALRVALARVAAATPTPGDHCRWCPARAGCPAVTQALARAPETAVATIADVQRVWPLLGPMADALDAMKARIRDIVAEYGDVPLPAGRSLRLVRGGGGGETVDIRALEKAMGPEKMVELREAGVIRPRAKGSFYVKEMKR
jgi:hypothetical protein